MPHMHAPSACTGLFVGQHLIGLLLLGPAALASDGTHCIVAITHTGTAILTASASALGFLLYNFISLYVLLLLDAVSHSICNTCRRAATIVVAAIIFDTPVSLPSALGICFIVGGSVYYAIAKETRLSGAQSFFQVNATFNSSAKDAGATDALLPPSPTSCSQEGQPVALGKSSSRG